MSEIHQASHKDHKKEYILVFAALSILTMMELYIPSIQNIRQSLKASSLIGLALGKAFMVAYFYMHLKDEKKWLRFIAAIPLVAGVYAIVLILESLFR